MLDLRTIQQSLQRFNSSPLAFHILCTLPYNVPAPPNAPQSVYILDSSFNPPTRAHFQICTSALLSGRPSPSTKRLLLLLATQNADKAPKPAAFEQRLVMMGIMANELIEAMKASSQAEESETGSLILDIGVTKEARFIDKARVLEKQEEYRAGKFPVEQVHLTGYDTLIRLLDPKYYPPKYTLEPLQNLFEKHRVRVTRRSDDQWGGRKEQDEYLEKLGSGQREKEGGRREWADRIELVGGKEEAEEIISSTKVREAAKNGDENKLTRLVTDGVTQLIIQEKLYQDNG